MRFVIIALTFPLVSLVPQRADCFGAESTEARLLGFPISDRFGTSRFVKGGAAEHHSEGGSLASEVKAVHSVAGRVGLQPVGEDRANFLGDAAIEGVIRIVYIAASQIA